MRCPRGDPAHTTRVEAGNLILSRAPEADFEVEDGCGDHGIEGVIDGGRDVVGPEERIADKIDGVASLLRGGDIMILSVKDVHVEGERVADEGVHGCVQRQLRQLIHTVSHITCARGDAQRRLHRQIGLDLLLECVTHLCKCLKGRGVPKRCACDPFQFYQ